jgi:hypothetical protein
MLSHQVLPMRPMIGNFDFALFASLHHESCILCKIQMTEQCHCISIGTKSWFQYPRTKPQTSKGASPLMVPHQCPLRIPAQKHSMSVSPLTCTIHHSSLQVCTIAYQKKLRCPCGAISRGHLIGLKWTPFSLSGSVTWLFLLQSVEAIDSYFSFGLKWTPFSLP